MHKDDFDPSRVLVVDIDQIELNDYNPKEKDTVEYQNVVSSLRIHGFKDLIFVREVEDNDKLVVVDGTQRLTAAKELGFSEVYVYNLGFISEDEAKAKTIWMQAQVPFKEMMLAPLVVKIADLGYEVPFTEEEVIDFRNLSDFEFVDTPKVDDGLGLLTIRATTTQYEAVYERINELVDNIGISEGEAVYRLCGGGDNVIEDDEDGTEIR